MTCVTPRCGSLTSAALCLLLGCSTPVVGPGVDGGPGEDGGPGGAQQGVADAGAAAGACTQDSDCGAQEYCAGMGCEIPGQCAPRPALSSCMQVLMPVCGCDGRSYPNQCVAEASGVRVAATGRCAGGRDGGFGGDGGFGRDGGFGGPPVMCGNITCGGMEQCCDATQSCYAPRCTNCCVSNAPSCSSNADCGPRQYCAGSGCGTSGLCEGRTMRCPPEMAPVCGCDGQTYMNECEAQAAGVRVASSGECTGTLDGGARDAGVIDAGGPTPGGSCVNAAQCAPSQYCATTTCGAAGNCQDRPMACSQVYQPVCGCDGQTYENACGAASNGVNVAYNGSCGADGGASDAGSSPDAALQ